MALSAALLFVSSFLLFALQPMLGKSILPVFGGSAAVWTTCLVFFPTLLFLGYLYAHFLVTRCAPRAQAAIHTVLLAGSLLLLPVRTPSEALAGDPALSLLTMLSVAAGLPYLLLASTGPLLQAWAAFGETSRTVYRLYALSNAASLIALLAYPVWIETHFSTAQQLGGWSAAYALFALGSMFLAWTRARRTQPETSRTPLSDTLLWIALAACGSALLVSITNHLCQNIAPVPLLWVLPLALYLLTLVLAFDAARWYPRAIVLRLAVLALCAMSYSLIEIGAAALIQLGIPLFLTGLFICCLFCHGELAARKPDPSRLTSFYLSMSLGGALGALATGALAPRILDGPYELPLSFLLLSAVACFAYRQAQLSQRMVWGGLAVAMVALVAQQIYSAHSGARANVRNFYGTLRVTESDGLRKLIHGAITHGAEFVAPARRQQALTYYGPESGVARAIGLRRQSAMRIGVIGLGAGTLAAYGRPGDEVRFYELNPLVVDLARTQFFYLPEAQASTAVVLGDGRLTLNAETDRRFDVLAVDAFSGDAIPVHLLTAEAFALYRNRLKPGGIMAFHVSNQYLNLAPVIALLAQNAGWRAVSWHSDADAKQGVADADWVLASSSAIPGTPIVVPPGSRLWTDGDNNLLQVLR